MKTIIKLLSLGLLVQMAACGKKYLEVKPDANLLVPAKLVDFQAMLDYSSGTSGMNESSPTNIGMIGGDEYNVTSVQYNTSGAAGAQEFQKNAYIWADRIYVGRETSGVDWTYGY